MAAHQALDRAHVVRGADERDRDHVYGMLDSKLQVFLVLFRKRGDAHNGARQVDSFVLAQQAAVDHLAFHIVAPDHAHPEFNQAVGQENSRSRFNLLGQRLERRGDQGCGTRNVAWRNRDHRAALEGNGCAVFKASGPYLGPLQVLEHADGTAFFLRDFAHALDGPRMLFVGAVREVKAGHVHAQPHEVPHNGFRVAGWTQRTNDLGSTR